MFTLIVAVIVIGVLVFVHELGHFALAKWNRVRVEKFSLGFGPKLLGITRGGTEYLISAVPLGGYVKMAGEEPGEEKTGAKDEYTSKTPFQRMQIIAAGPLMNFVLAFVIFAGLFFSGMRVATTSIGKVMDGYPAQKAGMMAGDKIIEIDGKKTEKWAEMLEIITTSGGRQMDFRIRRGEQELTLAIAPRVEEVTDLLGEKSRVAMIGVMPGEEFVVQKTGPGEAIVLAARHTWLMTELTYRSLWALVRGKVSAKNIGGPVMIAQMAGEQARAGFYHLLSFVAIISVNLGALNLLPIPVLDGGQLIFLFIETIRRKPLRESTVEWVQRICFALLMGLMVLVTLHDIYKIFG